MLQAFGAHCIRAWRKHPGRSLLTSGLTISKHGPAWDHDYHSHLLLCWHYVPIRSYGPLVWNLTVLSKQGPILQIPIKKLGAHTSGLWSVLRLAGACCSTETLLTTALPRRACNKHEKEFPYVKQLLQPAFVEAVPKH